MVYERWPATKVSMAGVTEASFAARPVLLIATPWISTDCRKIRKPLPEVRIEKPMDALSEILAAVKTEAALFYDAEFTAPWGFRSPSTSELTDHFGKNTRHVITYHLLTEGEAQAELENGTEGANLTPGDIVIFPHGDAHIIRNGMPPLVIDNGQHLDEILAHGIYRGRGGGGGAKTRFVCGYMEFDRELGRGFLSGLPPILKVNIRHDRGGQWLENSIRFSAQEAAAEHAGGEAVLAKLAEAVFTETMRRYMAQLPAEHTGWLAGARDPYVGEALALLHRSPEHRWTIAELAQKVGLSRSVLAERFRYFLGDPPMTYLARWRLRRAAERLRSTSHGVGQIAIEVGYESEPAFNRAFKREFGLPPARYRSDAKSRHRVAGA